MITHRTWLIVLLSGTLLAGLEAAPAAFGKEPAAFGKEPAALGKEPAALGKEPAALGKEPAALGNESADVSPAASDDMESVKRDLVALKRDLTILEEDLLFPASSQVAVFLSMDVGEFFQLDAVTVKLDGEEVTHHLYTERQVDALLRGGVQRLFLGNVKEGSHTLTAFFTGRGPSDRDYRRAATVEFDKTFEPAFIELAIRDSESKYQPEFTAAVSN